MSVVAPKLFRNTDTGAPAITGVVGDLVEVLSSCLIVRRAFSATSGASFADRTTEARLQGGTPFAPFQTPGTSDEFYVGMQRPFERILFTLATLGVGGTYVFEYWNGLAWTGFTPTDGTLGFTASGAVVWPIASLSTWATTTVNTFNLFWIRVRLTVANSTNPTINWLTTTGWSEAYTGTNQRAYQMGGGNQFFLNVNDNAPGAGGARECRIVGYETMSAIGTGTGPFPTVAQYATGMFIRKSAALAGAARTWVLVADDRTFYFSNQPGDSGALYTSIGFGDFYSFVSSDPFRTFIMARGNENASVADTVYSYDFGTRVDLIWGGQGGSGGINYAFASSGKFAARNFAGAIGATFVGAHPQMISAPSVINGFVGASGAGRLGYAGRISYPSTPDGGVYVVPVWMSEPIGAIGPNGGGQMQVDANTSYRGRFRGLWGWQHLYNAVADQTQFTGAGAMAGKSFLVLTPTERGDNNGNMSNGTMTFELSDTWETNV